MTHPVTETYDFIIVGAGSSGCVLAERLSANPEPRVLLVESGPDDTSPLIAMPRGIGKLLHPANPHTWAYDVSPGGNKPSELWLKGRAVGGSSAIKRPPPCCHQRTHWADGYLCPSWRAQRGNPCPRLPGLPRRCAPRNDNNLIETP